MMTVTIVIVAKTPVTRIFASTMLNTWMLILCYSVISKRIFQYCLADCRFIMIEGTYAAVAVVRVVKVVIIGVIVQGWRVKTTFSCLDVHDYIVVLLPSPELMVQEPQ